jgi:uncharacterized protein (TIRG00374 family)
MADHRRMQPASPSTAAGPEIEDVAGPAAGARRPRRRNWRRWLFVALSVGLLVFVASQFSSASELTADFSGADWRWVAVALVLQAAFFLLYGGLYRFGLAAVEVRANALRLVPVMLASIFAKTVLPLTAAPAAAVFIDDAMARGESGPRTAVGMIVVLVVDLVTALPFVLVGAAALVARATLVEFAVIGTVWFLGFIAVLVLGLVLAARRPSLLERLLGLVGAAVNGLMRRLGRRWRVPDDWAQLTTGQLVAGVEAVPRHPRDLVIASGIGLAVHVANLAGLAALFLAFGQPLDPAALAAGFGMGIVFFIVSIVPDGIGAVEGAMALTFVALGMDPPAAILVTIAFRVLNVWIPVGLGFVCARYLRLFGGQGLEGSGAPPQPT